MPETNLTLAGLVGSRICHDLISPIGAICNGLELLEMSGVLSDSPEMELIQSSVQNASARVRLFRVAFGATGSDTKMSAKEIRALLCDLGPGSRHEIVWNIEQDLTREEAQIAFLAIMCAETALPQGGTLVAQIADGRFQIQASGLTETANSAALTALKTGHMTDIQAGHVHFGLLCELSHNSGRPVDVLVEGSRLVLTI